VAPGEAWESVDSEVAEIIEASEGAIVVELLGNSRGRASGVETELRSWQLLRFADGKIARRQIFWTRDEALKAAGPRE
jgi:ketosteroid isomerase-like protein